MSRTVFCLKHQVEAEGLAFIPWPGALGKRVYESIGKPAWAEWLPITRVTWTSAKPFGPGTTRTVEVGAQVIEETFFAWEEGKRMAFRFERSTLPVSAAVEDYRIVPVEGGCELRWSGKASAPLFLGGVVTGQLTKGLVDGMPKLEALIARQPERFR